MLTASRSSSNAPQELKARVVDAENLYEEVSELRRCHAEAQSACEASERNLQQVRDGGSHQRLPAALRRAESLRSHSASDAAACSGDAQREGLLLSQLDQVHLEQGVLRADISVELREIDERTQRSEYLFQRLRDAESAVAELEGCADEEALQISMCDSAVNQQRDVVSALRTKLSQAQSQLSSFKSAVAAAVKAEVMVNIDVEDSVSSWHDFRGGLRANHVLCIGDFTWPLEAAMDVARTALAGTADRTLLELDGFPGLVLMTKSVASEIVSPPPPPVVSPIEVLREVLGQFKAMVVSQRVIDVVRSPSGICRVKDVALPKCFKGSLRHYQVEGFRWLASNQANGFGCLLADDMGLGKTIQTICLLCHLYEQGLMNVPALVVVPTSLLQNWQRELRTWAPSLSVYEYVGTGRTWPRAVDIVLTTYGIVRTSVNYGSSGARVGRGGGRSKARGVKSAPPKVLGQIGALVLDEAQRIKNKGSEVSRACKFVADGCHGMKLALSGTPVENRLEEMHSIFDVILPGYLGTVAQFKRTFAPKSKETDNANPAKLRKILDPFMLRRMKTDPAICPELPSKVDMRHDVMLTEKQGRIYNATLDHFMTVIARSQKRIRGSQIFAMVHALRKVCNHPATYEALPFEFPETISEAAEESGKTTTLLALLKDVLQQGEKCLIFAQYLSTIKLLGSLVFKAFGLRTVSFTGDLNRRQREETVRRFQTEPGCRVCFATLGAGGVGLNLTAASHVVHFDRCWNPAMEDQGSDRCHRIGQTSTVIVHRFITQGTFEERVDAILKAKQHLREACGEGGDATWLADYSDQELMDMFAHGSNGAAGGASSSTTTKVTGRLPKTHAEPGQQRLFEPPLEKSMQPDINVPASRPLLARLRRRESHEHAPPPAAPTSWQLLQDSVPSGSDAPRALHTPFALGDFTDGSQTQLGVSSSASWELPRDQIPVHARSAPGRFMSSPLKQHEAVDVLCESPIRSSPHRFASLRTGDKQQVRSAQPTHNLSLRQDAATVDVGTDTIVDDDVMVVSSDDDVCQLDSANSQACASASGSRVLRPNLGPFAKRQRLSVPGSFGGC